MLTLMPEDTGHFAGMHAAMEHVHALASVESSTAQSGACVARCSAAHSIRALLSLHGRLISPGVKNT